LRARVARLAPALHVRAQQVDERQLVALLLGVQLELRRAGPPGRVVVARGPAARCAGRWLARAAVDPVPLRLVVRRAEDRPLDRLDGGGLGGSGGGSIRRVPNHLWVSSSNAAPWVCRSSHDLERLLVRRYKSHCYRRAAPGPIAKIDNHGALVGV